MYIYIYKKENKTNIRKTRKEQTHGVRLGDSRLDLRLPATRRASEADSRRSRWTRRLIFASQGRRSTWASSAEASEALRKCGTRCSPGTLGGVSGGGKGGGVGGGGRIWFSLVGGVWEGGGVRGCFGGCLDLVWTS